MALIHLSTLITAGLIPAGASVAWSWIVTFDWGSFPDYLAGLGAVAALIWARKAVRAANRASEAQDRQLSLLIADRQEQEEEKRKSQAELVNAWLEDHGVGFVPEIIIRNVSQAPVLAVVVTAQTELYADDGYVTFNLWRPIVRPDTTEMRIHIKSPVLAGVLAHIKTQTVSLAFTDSSGNHWERDQDGKLVRHEDPMIWWGDKEGVNVFIQPYPDNINIDVLDMLPTRVDVDKDLKGDPVNITIRKPK